MSETTLLSYVLPGLKTYGAPEIKRSSRKFFVGALTAATVLHLIVFSVFWAPRIHGRNTVTPANIHEIDYTELGATEPYSGRVIMESINMMPIPVPSVAAGNRFLGPGGHQQRFQVDPSLCGICLKWIELTDMDPTADIWIVGEIDSDGIFRVTKQQFSGHNEIGQRILDAMATWRYRPYANGEIRFWFNFASLNDIKLEVDVSRMTQSRDLQNPGSMDYGPLYWIDGIPRNAVQLLVQKE
jgi:hypothetical protein